MRPAAVAELRLLQPGLPTVLVVEPAASRRSTRIALFSVKRPLDPRQLLGCVVELVLREDDLAAPAPRHGTAAELGIAAARLACLHNRHSAAAATGAARLAQDLKRQIGEVRSTCRGLAAASAGLRHRRLRRLTEPRRSASRFSFSSIIASTLPAPCRRHSCASAFGSSGSGA